VAAKQQKVDHYKDLQKKIASEFGDRIPVATDSEAALGISIAWLRHFYEFGTPSNASTSLLDAAHSAAIEVTSSVACGLVRPAIFSLRSHYEFFFMYLFYKDHPVEWSSLQNGNEWVRLPKELKTYLRQYYPWSETRLKKLNDVKSRKEDDPYFVLSAFVHGGKLQTLPKARLPKETCFALETVKQMPNLIADISEYLSDVATSVYSGNFLGLPPAVKTNLTTRFAKASEAEKIFN